MSSITSKKRTKKNINFSKKELSSSKKLSFFELLFPPTILLIITTIIYSFSLNYPFQFDDLANISKKFAIRSDNPLSRWLTNARWMGDFLSRINFEIGRFDPFSYRLFSLIIHLLSGILLFYLVLSLCRCLEKKSFIFKNSLLISFTTSALFLLHPVQTQTISYVIQARIEGLASLFSIATILIMVNALKTHNKTLKFILMPLGYLFAFLSCGTKEIVVVVPLLLLACDWFFISDSKWNNFRKRILYHAAFFIFFYLVFLNYIGGSFISRALGLKMTITNNRGNIITNNANTLITPLQFFISEFKVMLHYLTMFLWPFNISVEYDWKLSESFFSIDSFFPFLILASLATFTIYSFIKKRHKAFVFGIIWFFVTICPRTTIIPSPELLCDYKTYLASAGWLFAIAVGLVHLVKFLANSLENIPSFFKKATGQFATLLFLMILVGIGAYNRNTVWRTSVEFWEDIVKKAPLKARGHNNYGVALAEANRIDEAIIQYKKAISLDNLYADPLSNLAVAYSLKDKTDLAINSLKAAINIHPNYPEAYNNLGTLLLKQKNYDDAKKSLDMAIKLRPHYGKAYYNQGRLAMEQGDDETAWSFFKKATEGDLDTKEGFLTLGQMSLKLKKYDEAEKAFTSIIKLGQNDEYILFNLANAYFMNKKLDQAENIYKKLHSNAPLVARYVYNWGETLYAKNEIEKALSLFRKVTTMPNPLAQSFLRVANCYEKLEKVDMAKQYLNGLLKANASDQFKQIVRNEIGRIELAEKVKEGNGQVKMAEIQKILKKTAQKA